MTNKVSQRVMLSRDLLAPRLLPSAVNSFFAVNLAMLSPIVLATTITLDIQDGAGEGFGFGTGGGVGTVGEFDRIESVAGLGCRLHRVSW